MAEGADQGESSPRNCRREFDEELPGVTFNFSQYIQDNIEEALSGVKGAKLGQGRRTRISTCWSRSATKVMDVMRDIQGVTDLGVFHLVGQPNLNIKIDQRESRALRPEHRRTSPRWCRPRSAAPRRPTCWRADRYVRRRRAARSEVQAECRCRCASIKVAYATPSGTNTYVPLSELADISLDTGALFIYRERSQRYIPIKFSVRGRDLGSPRSPRPSGALPRARCSFRPATASSGPASSTISRPPRHG